MDLDLDPNLELELDLDLNLGLRLRLFVLGSARLWLWLWLAWVSGGLEWPGIRRRLVLVELDDGSGGLAAGWAFVEGTGGEVVVSGEVEEIVSGGGSGCDVEVEVAFGFDLAADANSAGNGVLLAAMPQAYSILPQVPLSLSLSNLKPCPGWPA